MQHHRGQGRCDVTAVTSQILVEKPGNGAHVRKTLSISDHTVPLHHILYQAKKGTNDSHIRWSIHPVLKESALLKCFLELWVNPQVISVHARVKGPIPWALLLHLIAGTRKRGTGSSVRLETVLEHGQQQKSAWNPVIGHDFFLSLSAVPNHTQPCPAWIRSCSCQQCPTWWQGAGWAIKQHKMTW